MPILYGVLAALVVLFFAIKACGWIAIPVFIGTVLVVGLIWGVWQLAGRLTSAAISGWWAANWARLLRAVVLLAIAGMLVLILKSIWDQLPACGGGCPGGDTTASAGTTPDTSATTTPVAPLTPIRSMDVVVTKEFSNDIPVPPGQMVLWESVEGVPFDILTPSGSTYPQPRRAANDTRTPCERMVWISEAASSFKVRIAQDAPENSMTFRIVYYPYRTGGPCA